MHSVFGCKCGCSEEADKLLAENERLKNTLEAKGKVQKTNEDEMSAENKRLREAMQEIARPQDCKKDETGKCFAMRLAQDFLFDDSKEAK
jgi:hypothetical protein